MKARMRLRTFDDLVVTDLRDDFSNPEFAQGYLQACLEEAQAHDDIGIFLIGLMDVTRARDSVAGVAEQAGKTRASFYKSLSGTGNPAFATIFRTLPALGLKFHLVAAEPDTAAKPAPKRRRAPSRKKEEVSA